MTDPEIPLPPALRRTASFGPRWLVATVLVAVVFLSGRATVLDHANHPDTPEARPAPKTGWGIDDPTQGPTASDGGVEELPGPVETDSTVEDTGAATYAVHGELTNGTAWSMQVPSDWIVHNEDAMTGFDSPDYPHVALVVTRDFIGPLEDEAARDIGDLQDSLPDMEILDLVATRVEGRPAEQALVSYTTPEGQQAHVTMTWIQDDDSLVLIAGEAPMDAPDVQDTVDTTLNSFTFTETV